MKRLLVALSVSVLILELGSLTQSSAPTARAGWLPRHSIALVSALCHDCIDAQFGYTDENLLNTWVRLDASADRGDGISSGIKSVYYEIVASNDDSGYKKTFKGTDAVEGGKHWDRSVEPAVGWGHLTFTYHIKVNFKNGQSVWANKVTQTYNR